MTFSLNRWLEDLAVRAREDSETYFRLGFADLRLVVEAVDDDGTTHDFGLVLDGYDVIYTGELDNVDTFRPDATITGPASVWEEMAANIGTHGGADRYHTLNAMTIADEPLRVSSDDPIGRDKFFRYAETLQTLFDGTAARMAIVD